MSGIKKYTQRPLLWMMILLPIISFISCEDFEDKTYLMSDQEEFICNRLNDSLDIAVTAADLFLFGPAWTGDNISSAFEGTVRIDASWYTEEFELVPDVYVFIDDTDTLAAMKIIEFNYNETSGQAEDIKIAYIYNPLGTPNFTGLSKDTLLIPNTYTATAFIDFSQGLVGESDNWTISIEDGAIKQSADSKVYRIAGGSLATFKKAPSEYYAADIAGFEVAVDYLSSDSVYLPSTDSLLAIKLESKTDAGYLLFDRSGEATAEIVFNVTDYLTIAIWDANGLQLEPVDKTISMQVVAYCPDVKTKAVYALENKSYLIQFLPDEEMEEQNFSLVMVKGE
ncbi:MAG: hypothetical protein K9N35_11135 [Candidatus Marinimicrobia bacterium]|nr:hypothetical protein [Candidatus Neomarinimicrobiota bacterium]